MGHDEEMGDKNLLLKKLTKKLEESETGDENIGHEVVEEDNNQNQESDVESMEDIKSLLKSKKKKRKYRHSDETEDEDRRFKRIDTKKELEKLEKLLKRNGNNDEKKSSHFKGRGGGGLAMFESGENNGENTSEEEEAGLVRFKKYDKSNSGEEIRTKLEEYKNKLIEYETRKKNIEKNDDKTHTTYSRKISSLPDEQFLNDIDAQKAIEALALISKVEGAIRDVGSSSEKINYEKDPRNSKPRINLASDIGEEMMIEELEKSDKTKRMIDPKSLGGKIYRFFVSNGHNKAVHKRSVENLDTDSQRGKRDLEKLLGDDPLGLRKEGLFKKRLKTDEAKERRLERRNRKKEKEEIGLKKELPVGRYDPRITDSNENNFFGFPEMKPLENFPKGDVFLNEGSSSEEKSHDYDYVKDDDDEEVAKQQQKKSNKRRKSKNQRQNKVVQDDTWVEEPNPNLLHTPNEFFEKVNLPAVAIKTQWKNYGELYEPEALQQGDFKEEQKAQDNETPGDAVIARDQTDEREDKRAKETAVKKLINYYDNSEVVRNEREEFERQKPRTRGTKREPKPIAQASMQRKTKEILKIKPEETQQEENTMRVSELDDDQFEDSADPGSLEFVNSEAVDDYSEELTYGEDEIGAKKRPKRKIANLDFDIFGQEMIREDAGNLRDCKCRVIRSTGKLECKNCKRSRRRQREIPEINLQEDITDPTLATTIDHISVPEESTTGELLTETNEAPEIIQGESAVEDIPYSREAIETSSAIDINRSLQKNTELADLNGDSYLGANDGDGLAPESSSPSINDADSEKIGLNETTEPENELQTEPQVISGSTERETGMQKSDDDVVGSQRVNEGAKESEAADEIPEEFGLNNKEDVEEKKREMVEMEKNLSPDDVADDKNAKRHIPSNADANSATGSSTKISLSTGSSLKTDLLNTKSKNGVDFRLKSGGLRSDSAKSKLILNTEALSALIKENESKKADVIRALESSSKLKSVDNAKYAEYQRKREVKLANLKDKLRERKAKILQQYRQELLDALTKCDDEVERNLKRREIWDDFSNQEEFQEFVDKDKLAYLMMNRPVNYEDVEEQRDDGFSQTEDRRYRPEVDVIQPLRSPREQKIPSNEYRGFFYSPKSKQFSSPSREAFFDQSSAENVDEPYYAIVESLEYPKIFHRQDFDDLNRAYENEYDNFIKMRDSALKKSQKPSKSETKRHNDHRVEEKHAKNYNQEKHSAREYLEKPVPRVYAIDGSAYYGGEPVLHVYDEDFSQEYRAVPYYDEYPDRDGDVLQKIYDRQEVADLHNARYDEDDSSWDSLIPEYHDGILHHRQYSRPIYNSGSRQKLGRTRDAEEDRESRNPEKLASPKRSALHTGVKSNPDELFGNDIADIPLSDGWRILKKLNSPCSDGTCRGQANFGDTKELDESERSFERPIEDQRAFNQGKPLVRNERHLVPHEKQILDEPAYLPVRRERDVKETQSNYVCLREDSSEDFGDDEQRLFKLVRNKDHYEAVPIPDVGEEDHGAGRQRKNQRRAAKQIEKVRNTRRKYNAEVFTDEEGNYYLKNGGYIRRDLPKRKYSKDRELLSKINDVEGKSESENDKIDYVNRLESYPRLTPEEYELLMLIPVKKNKSKRQRRDLSNSIDRWESIEDMNSVWDDAVDVEKSENRLQEYIDGREKNLRNFEETQANLNKYLKKIGGMQDPGQIDKFKKVILNLGTRDQDEMAVVAQSQDDLDRIHLGEYLKKEILKRVDEELHKSTTFAPVPGTTTTPSTLFDAAMPKLEITINEELEKVGNLTESLEDFINEFDQRFNTTSETEIKNNVTGSETPTKNDKISYNIFHNAINNVKKFFNFLTGLSLIFRRH